MREGAGMQLRELGMMRERMYQDEAIPCQMTGIGGVKRCKGKRW